MRITRYFPPILKEMPKEAEIVSHRLMLRVGMIRQEAARDSCLAAAGPEGAAKNLRHRARGAELRRRVRGLDADHPVRRALASVRKRLPPLLERTLILRSPAEG